MKTRYTYVLWIVLIGTWLCASPAISDSTYLQSQTLTEEERAFIELFDYAPPKPDVSVGIGEPTAKTTIWMDYFDMGETGWTTVDHTASTSANWRSVDLGAPYGSALWAGPAGAGPFPGMSYLPSMNTQAVTKPGVLDFTGMGGDYYILYWAQDVDLSNDTEDYGKIEMYNQVDGKWDTLYIIPPGLNTQGMVKHQVYLNDTYDDHTQARLRFIFFSNHDNQVDEGWYIDDVKITRVPWVYVAPESFEYGFPPKDWTTQFTNPIYKWIRATETKHTGTASCKVQAELDQDEWLITPKFVIPGLASCYLTFWWNHETNENNHINIKASINDGVTWPYNVDVIDSADLDNFWEREKVIDLSFLAGHDNVRIAWQYVGSNGRNFFIDDVKIISSETIIYENNMDSPAATMNFEQAPASGDLWHWIGLGHETMTNNDGYPIYKSFPNAWFCGYPTSVRSDGQGRTAQGRGSWWPIEHNYRSFNCSLVSPNIDISGWTPLDIMLIQFYNRRMQEHGTFHLEASSNGGVTWVPLEYFNTDTNEGRSTAGGWRYNYYSSIKGWGGASQFKFRFVAGMNSLTFKDYSYWYIDNVRVVTDIAGPKIVHTPLRNTFSTSSRTISAEIEDDSGIGTPHPRVYYRINGTGNWSDNYVTLSLYEGNTWVGTLPGQAAGSTVDYFIEARDNAPIPNISTAPENAPILDYYSYKVLPSSAKILVYYDGIDTEPDAYTRGLSSITTKGVNYDVYQRKSTDPATTILSYYDMVIWDEGTFLTASQQAALITFLNSGTVANPHKLFIVGEDIGQWHKDDEFYQRYLNASFVYDNPNTRELIGWGRYIDELKAENPDVIEFSQYADGNFSDSLLYYYYSSGKYNEIAAISVVKPGPDYNPDDPEHNTDFLYDIVYFAFPFSGIPDDQQISIMQRVYNLLGNPWLPIPSLSWWGFILTILLISVVLLIKRIKLPIKDQG